ncbi:CotH kinase family protein [Clostridium perfringens]
MAIKVYDKNKKKWEIQADNQAVSINVLDIDKKYSVNNKNVESCLSEVKEDIAEINKKVKYIYENGTLGGSGGGGVTPTLKIMGDKEYTVTSDEILTIAYSFTSPNRGNGKAILTFGEKIEEVEVAQGRIYKWKVGTFAKGEHILSINVCDAQGFWSGLQEIKVISGAIELIDHFDSDQMFLAGELVEIPYEISAISNSPITVEYISNGKKTKITETPGSKVWRCQLGDFKGIYKASIKAYSDKLESNTLNYTLIVSDSKTLLISSTMPQSPDIITAKYGQNIVIDYTNSMLGQFYYDTYFYIDNMEDKNYIDKVRSQNGRNYWTVGDRLTIGQHKLKIKSVTTDGQNVASIEFIVNVSSFGFTPHQDTKEGLIAHFEATGNMNESDTRNIWENRVANSPITCELFNFNYSSNGWIQVPKVSDLPISGQLNELNLDKNRKETILRCSGKSRAVINYKPFEHGIPKGRGFTFEIVFRTENTGDIKAKVVSCKNEPLANKGFEIDIENAIISTSYGEQVAKQFNENAWTRVSFVVDRVFGLMKIYCNGVLSGVTYIQSKYGEQDGFKYDGQIVLGGCLKREFIPGIGNEPDKTIESWDNFSNCDIRTVRIYDRALSDKELLDNFIADVKDEQEQMILRKTNGLETGFEMTIPIVNIFPDNNADIENAGENAINTCKIDYQDPRNSQMNKFFEHCTIQWQGTSSKEYPVKNYTIILKENGTDYYGWSPKKNWYPEARWTLKANYMDSSQANNVGAAKFIHDFFKTNMYPIQKEIRPNSDGGVRETRTNIDGFPIMLKINGQFKGIYTFNIDRYSNNNYGFAEYEENGNVTPNRKVVSYEIAINNGTSFIQDYSTPEKIQKAWDDVVRHEFRHRYNGKTDRPTETILIGGQPKEVLSEYSNHTDLLNLLEWISQFKDTPTDRNRFADELDEHFSIPHLIDYFLICYALGMIDSLGKNLVLTTYGKEEDSEGNLFTIWYPTFYDCDSILGINNVGRPVVTPGAEMHTEYVTQDSRLWKWLIENPKFATQIKTRYMQLREPLRNPSGEIIGDAIFSVNNIMKYIGGEVVDTIGQGIYNNDFKLKYLIPQAKDELYMCQGSRRSFTERWLTERFTFLDSLYGYGKFEESLLTMRTNKTGELTLKIRTYSPQKTIVQFTATDAVVLTTDKNKETIFTCNVTNGKDNELKIKGANNLMTIEGLEELNVSELKIGGAEKLTNVELPNSNLITELELGNNKYLRTLDLSNCRMLGKDNASGRPNNNKTLKLGSCSNLRVLKCPQTAILGIQFPSEGGVLDELDCSETGLTDFDMKGQEYLDFINLAGCPQLSKVNIQKCDGLTKLSAPRSALSSFIVDNCKKLEDVDISFTNQLQTFKVVECPNIKKLNMSGVSNNYIQELNLSSLLNLEDLRISGSTSIRHIIFGKNPDGTKFNKLKVFKCDNSAITTIRYGQYEPIPSALDLSGLPLEDVSFNSCKNVSQILNIKLNTSNGSYAFNECTNLTRITGELTFRGRMDYTFQNCIKLKSIPTGDSTGNRLNLSGVTAMNSTFWRSNADLNMLKAVMSKVSSSFVDSYRVFNGCNNIVTNDSTPLPENLFANCTKLTSLSEFFHGCSNIGGGLHDDLLKPMKELRNCYRTFSYTSITGGRNSAPLGETFFNENRHLQNTERMFDKTNMLFAPSNNMFVLNTELSNVYGMFSGCSNMVGEIPSSIFRNNPRLSSVGAFFADCSKMSGEIPRKIFDTNNGRDNSLTTVEGFFQGTGISGEIPAYRSNSDKGIFDYSPNLSWTRNCFANCKNLIGSIPPDIFKYNNALIRVDGTFAWCDNLGSTPDKPCSIPPNLLKGKKLITNVSYLFAGLRYLSGTIPEGLLNDCPNITDISGMFAYCSKLVGQIPARESKWIEVPLDPERPELGNTQKEIVEKYGLFDKCTIISTAKEVFKGCTGLNSFIPSTLFISGTMITDLTEVFAECYYLQGEIPAGLFKKCGNLRILNSAFRNCVNLANPLYDENDEINKYAIPEDLFSRNPNLNDVRGMFRMDGGGNPNAPKLVGAISPKLFQVPGANLRDISYMFYRCLEINNDLKNGTFDYNTQLKTAEGAFSSTKLKTLGNNLFSKCKKLENMVETFDHCSQLTGRTFDYKNMTSVVEKARCFGYCTGLENYEEAKRDGWAD